MIKKHEDAAPKVKRRTLAQCRGIEKPSKDDVIAKMEQRSRFKNKLTTGEKTSTSRKKLKLA